MLRARSAIRCRSRTAAGRYLDHKDIRLFLPAESRLLLDGVTIDFAETPTESGFVFREPGKAGCGCRSATDPAVAVLIGH